MNSDVELKLIEGGSDRILVTELYQKQMLGVEDVIEQYNSEFFLYMFGTEAQKMIEEGELIYHISLKAEHLYVQQWWTNAAGEDKYLSLELPYDEVNKWYKGLDL